MKLSFKPTTSLNQRPQFIRPIVPQRLPKQPNPSASRTEKRIFVVLLVILILSITLAWYISSSANHTLSTF